MKIISEILEMFLGCIFWHLLKRKYQIELTDYLFLATDEVKLFNSAMSYLPEFMKKKYSKKAVVVHSYAQMPQKQTGVIFVKMPKGVVKAMVRFYRFERFAERVVVISLEEPFGSYGLLKCHDIALKDIVINYLMV